MTIIYNNVNGIDYKLFVVLQLFVINLIVKHAASCTRILKLSANANTIYLEIYNNIIQTNL